MIKGDGEKRILQCRGPTLLVRCIAIGPRRYISALLKWEPELCSAVPP